MTAEEWKLVQEVAATEARACEIIVAADKLVEMLGKYDAHPNKTSYSAVLRALIDYVVVRKGS